jgi:Domain of unknown function (DUF4160)
VAARRPEAGARCGSAARRDLCGGCRVTGIPTATPTIWRHNHTTTLWYDKIMPELARFLGTIIRMYAEPSAPHHRPHFHAYYQEAVGIYSIDTVELISGALPRRQHRFVEAWAELHQDEL